MKQTEHHNVRRYSYNATRRYHLCGGGWMRNNERNNNGEEKMDEQQLFAQQRTFAQHGAGQGFCHCCGSKDHMSPECTEKALMEKKDWIIDE